MVWKGCTFPLWPQLDALPFFRFFNSLAFVQNFCFQTKGGTSLCALKYATVWLHFEQFICHWLHAVHTIYLLMIKEMNCCRHELARWMWKWRTCEICCELAVNLQPVKQDLQRIGTCCKRTRYANKIAMDRTVPSETKVFFDEGPEEAEQQPHRQGKDNPDDEPKVVDFSVNVFPISSMLLHWDLPYDLMPTNAFTACLASRINSSHCQRKAWPLLHRFFHNVQESHPKISWKRWSCYQGTILSDFVLHRKCYTISLWLCAVGGGNDDGNECICGIQWQQTVVRQQQS